MPSTSFERLAGEESARLRPARPGDESRIERVDVERQVDGARPLPRDFQRDLDGLVDPDLLDVVDGQDRRAALPPHLHAGAGHLPASDPELHQVRRRAIRDIRGVEPRTGVHDLVHVLFLRVHVAVDVDDPHLALHALRNRAGDGIADRVVAAHDHRQRALRQDVRDALGDLVVALGDVGRAEDVADVAHGERLAQVDPVLVAVLLVERRDAPHPLRPEPGARAERAADVERRPHERDVVFAHLADVLDVRQLQEGVDARPVRRAPSLEATDVGLVLDRIGRLQAQFLDPTVLLLVVG